ncbi:MAG: hypothetical protein AAF567_12000 [Actinomycetota bacterium]
MPDRSLPTGAQSTAPPSPTPTSAQPDTSPIEPEAIAVAKDAVAELLGARSDQVLTAGLTATPTGSPSVQRVIVTAEIEGDNAAIDVRLFEVFVVRQGDSWVVVSAEPT